MKKGKKLYEGKAKIIYATNDKELVIQHFKDDATAFNNLKKAKIEGKGVLNNLNITKGTIFSQELMLELTKSGLSREKSYRLVQAHAKKCIADEPF